MFIFVLDPHPSHSIPSNPRSFYFIFKSLNNSKYAYLGKNMSFLINNSKEVDLYSCIIYKNVTVNPWNDNYCY